MERKPWYSVCKEHLRSRSLPYPFNYPGYLRWTQQFSLSRVQAQQYWANAISFLEQHDQQALRDTSQKMKQTRYSAINIKLENELFFKAKCENLHEKLAT
ncbi:hypothetical protein BGX27_000483 [Mortierella sp. AM989]|nr:hypothetical protein BGX27_000483 [Mortierella sp. AM989]